MRKVLGTLSVYLGSIAQLHVDSLTSVKKFNDILRFLTETGDRLGSEL
jgi:hypothetical protein